MGSTSATLPALNIVIVGAGIAGLATATARSRNGKSHKITILESHPSLNEFGAPIDITPNGVRGLRSLNLESEFAKVVVRNNFLWMSEGFTNKTIGYIPQNKNNYSKTNYGDENWVLSRIDHQNVFFDAAVACGATIIFGIEIQDVNVESCKITCSDGQSFSADTIIGADGMKSLVRKHIPKASDVEPVAWISETAYRCTLPKVEMIGNSLLQDLLDNPPAAFDVVLGITESGDVPLGKWGYGVDVKDVTSKLRYFCPKIKKLLSHVDRAVKWTLEALSPLETCKSDNGCVVLIGDAWHAMLPHSASGGNSAIEDAVSPAECLQWAWEKRHSDEKDLNTGCVQATRACEGLSKPIVERMQRAGHEGYTSLSAGGEDAIHLNNGLAGAKHFYDAELALPDEERIARRPVAGDMDCRYGLEPYFQWLYRYDAVTETMECLKKLQ